MERVQNIHKTLRRCDDNPLGSHENEVMVRHGELGAVRGPDFEWDQSALQPLANILNRHTVSLNSVRVRVNVNLGDAINGL